MKIDANLKATYPKLSKWIETNLPQVKNKPKVWKAFLKYSEQSEASAKLSITLGTPPEIHYKLMPKSNGQYIGGKFPNRVFLAKSICDKFEKMAMQDLKMDILLESTLLHEMVHWGDFKDKKDQAGEEGKNFEKEAYGKNIERYW